MQLSLAIQPLWRFSRRGQAARGGVNAAQFETNMLRIGELFSDAATYFMPGFQRPYCWDEQTAAQLYDDISSAMVRGRPERPSRKNREEYFSAQSS